MKWTDKLAGWFSDLSMGTPYKSDLLDAFVGATQGGQGARAVVATAAGLTTGVISADDTFVIITNGGSVNNISKLPACSEETIGRTIKILASAANSELQTTGTGCTINNVDCSGGAVEALLTAGNFYLAIQTLANGWILLGFTNLGAVQTAVVPD